MWQCIVYFLPFPRSNHLLRFEVFDSTTQLLHRSIQPSYYDRYTMISTVKDCQAEKSETPLAGAVLCCCSVGLEVYRTEGIAGLDRACLQSSSEPADPLIRAAVGKGIGRYVAA